MDPLQVVAEPRRRAILRLVWDRELAAGDIAAQLPVSFAAVSQHLGVLRSASLVTVRAEGKRRLYRANHDTLAPFADILRAVWGADLDRLKAAAEADDAARAEGKR